MERQTTACMIIGRQLYTLLALLCKLHGKKFFLKKMNILIWFQREAIGWLRIAALRSNGFRDCLSSFFSMLEVFESIQKNLKISFVLSVIRCSVTHVCHESIISLFSSEIEYFYLGFEISKCKREQNSVTSHLETDSIWQPLIEVSFLSARNFDQATLKPSKWINENSLLQAENYIEWVLYKYFQKYRHVSTI